MPNDQYACTIAACKTPAFDEERPQRLKPKTDPGLKPRQPLMLGLLERQRALGAALPSERLLRLDALATAPFTTGLGNEHPLENGSAFLNPYGLPYLPGSGVKGVLRQAARELASGEWRDHAGWNDEERYILQAGKKRISLSVLDVLFGKESDDGDTDHVRGALSFWDVIPQITSDHLMVEIMTPHQKHYYQDGQSPNESGQPNPISFLTVPPGSGFTFHVLCDRAHLARLTKSRVEGVPDLLTEGPTHWKTLLTDAFEHAFAWLGLGAKTAVGYGAMVRDRRADEAKAKKAEEEAERAAREDVARRQSEAEAAEAARRQAQFHALPESEKALLQLDKDLARFEGQSALSADRYADLAGVLSRLAEQAKGWRDSEARNRAADRLEANYDRFGWAAPGLKRDKREKQERKRRETVATVRGA